MRIKYFYFSIYYDPGHWTIEISVNHNWIHDNFCYASLLLWCERVDSLQICRCRSAIWTVNFAVKNLNCYLFFNLDRSSNLQQIVTIDLPIWVRDVTTTFWYILVVTCHVCRYFTFTREFLVWLHSSTKGGSDQRTESRNIYETQSQDAWLNILLKQLKKNNIPHPIF